MRNNTPKLMILAVSLALAACRGVNSPTAADSTTLYTGPLPKADASSEKDTMAADSIKVGPDNFTVKDSTKREARGKKSASTE